MNKKVLESINMMTELTKQKKDKRKVRRRGRRMEMKVLLKSKYIKKAKKEDYINDLAANFGSFEKELRKCFGNEHGKGKVFDDREDVVDLLTNKKFSKYLCKVLKEMKDTDEVPYVVLFAIGDMYVNNDAAFVEDEELAKRYMKVVDGFYSGKIKKLAKKLGVSKSIALSLLLASMSFKDVRHKFTFKRTFAFLNLLYDMDGLNEKKVKIALKECYGKRLFSALTTILNESPKNTEAFSIVTNAALSLLNGMEKDSLKTLLKNYAKRRKQNPKAARRVALSKINEEDYKNIHRTIEKLVRTGFNKELFM